MSEQQNHPTQGLLERLRDGDPEALESLFSQLYDELRGLAHAQMRKERPGHTLETSGLVHEAYMKIARGPLPESRDRGHFLAIAARAMRQVLVDHARKAGAARRGGSWDRVSLGPGNDPGGRQMDPAELIALDDALEGLARIDERLLRVVELRYFAGLSEKEVAELLGVTVRTVQRDWTKARAWLYRQLYEGRQTE